MTDNLSGLIKFRLQSADWAVSGRRNFLPFSMEHLHHSKVTETALKYHRECHSSRDWVPGFSPYSTCCKSLMTTCVLVAWKIMKYCISFPHWNNFLQKMKNEYFGCQLASQLEMWKGLIQVTSGTHNPSTVHKINPKPMNGKGQVKVLNHPTLTEQANNSRPGPTPVNP